MLHELILPVETRIRDVRNFLQAIDSTLTYDVVAIQDIFGPTKTDPDLDVIYGFYFFFKMEIRINFNETFFIEDIKSISYSNRS